MRLRSPARRPSAPAREAAARGRPVLLVTLAVPFDEAATVFAVDTAVELGAALVCANLVELEPLPVSRILGYEHLETPELTEALRRPAELARSLGVEVERLRVQSFRPVEAMIELAAERRPGVLVFGPERRHMRARAYKKAARAVTEQAACLVWLAEEAA